MNTTSLLHLTSQLIIIVVFFIFYTRPEVEYESLLLLFVIVVPHLIEIDLMLFNLDGKIAFPLTSGEKIDPSKGITGIANPKPKENIKERIDKRKKYLNYHLLILYIAIILVSFFTCFASLGFIQIVVFLGFMNTVFIITFKSKLITILKT